MKFWKRVEDWERVDLEREGRRGVRGKEGGRWIPLATELARTERERARARRRKAGRGRMQTERNEEKGEGGHWCTSIKYNCLCTNNYVIIRHKNSDIRQIGAVRTQQC